MDDREWHLCRLQQRQIRSGQSHYPRTAYPYLTPTDLPAYRAAAAAVEETFGKEPLPYYSGGSIPIISTFEKEFELLVLSE